MAAGAEIRKINIFRCFIFARCCFVVFVFPPGFVFTFCAGFLDFFGLDFSPGRLGSSPVRLIGSVVYEAGAPGEQTYIDLCIYIYMLFIYMR